MIRERYKHAGETVKIKGSVSEIGGMEFEIEDYWENVNGKSWMVSNGNFSAMRYAYHAGRCRLPIDNEVVYGKIGNSGFLVHISELELDD